jgi:hypothetical protein
MDDPMRRQNLQSEREVLIREEGREKRHKWGGAHGGR